MYLIHFCEYFVVLADRSSLEVEAEAALDMFKMYDAVKEVDAPSKKQM